MASTWWDQVVAPPSRIAPPQAVTPPTPDATPPPPPSFSGAPEGSGAVTPPNQRFPAWPNNTAPGPGTPTTTNNAPVTPPDTTNYGQGATGANAEFLAWLNKTHPKPADIPGMVDQINQKYGLGTGHGLQWYPDRNVVAASGGGYWALTNTSDPNSAWGYNVGDSGKTTIDPGALGPLLQPFGETPPTFSLPTYKTPDPFKAPSADEALNDPGYKFRLGQGQQVLENSASARGLLNSGGTLKDILDYGQNAASQEYQNVFNRDLGTYQTNVQTQNVDPYKFAYQQGLDTNNQSWNNYLQRYAQFRNYGTDTFNRLYGFASLGAQTAGA